MEELTLTVNSFVPVKEEVSSHANKLSVDVDDGNYVDFSDDEKGKDTFSDDDEE